GETWELTEDHVAALAELEVTHLQRPERYQVWLQTADETLDYRAAQAFYRACALRIQAGGDHGFQGFARHLPALLAFAGYPSALWRDT
ncbi:YqiA/YcfP family alpha/beta fold hydrolase, partial [Pseudomonas aeruginosa]